MSEATLLYMSIQGTDFTEATLTRSIFYGDYVVDSVFTRANLRGSQWYINTINGGTWTHVTCPSGIVQDVPCPQLSDPA